MLNCVQPKTQAAAQMRAAITGLLCGVLGFVIWRYWFPMMPNHASAIQLAQLTFALSAIAGAVAALLVPMDGIDDKGAASWTALAGLRSGLFAALAGGGLILAVSVVGSFTAPTWAVDAGLRVMTWHTFFVLLAAFFCSAPAGVFGAMTSLAIRRPDIARNLAAAIFRPSSTVGTTDKSPADGTVWLTRALVSAGVLGFLSPVILLFLPMKVDPPPPIVKHAPAPPTIPPPPPLSFQYVKPRGFDHADPGQLVITARKNIPAAAPDCPKLFSSDSRLFAYCRANSNHATVAVFDLDSFEEIATFDLPRMPIHLAWSPDFQRLFYLIHDKDDQMGVLNLQTRGVIAFPAAAPDSPMLFSSDSHLFAYCRENSNLATVAVLNLDTFNEVAAFVLPKTPTHLAWSPDFQRLFYVTQTKESRMGVLNLQTRSIIELPRPKNRDLPDGRPDWWLSNHVSFSPVSEASLDLDLDSLLLGRLDESPAFKAADPETKDRSKYVFRLDGWQKVFNKIAAINNEDDSPRFEFPKEAGWQMMLDGCIQRVQPPPRKEPSQPWSTSGFATLAFVRQEGIQARQWMPQILIEQGDLVLPAPDGSKIFHHTGDQSEVIYFGTREKVPSLVSIKMPHASDKKKYDDEMAALIKKNRLCAFVYAPMTNPLTGKTIGPDREHVRAILRITKLDGETADFWAAVQLYDVQIGDVVADLHTWDGGQLTIANASEDSKWWDTIVNAPRADRDAIPILLRPDDLDRGIALDVTRQSYAFAFQKITETTHTVQKRGTAELALVEKPPVGPPEAAIPKYEIEKFVFDHHDKISNGNVSGFMADYDKYVDYLGHFLSRTDIEKDEREYHQKWNRVSEAPRRPISISMNEGVIHVSYTIAFRTESTSQNRWISGENDLILLLARKQEGGFLIKEPRASIHDRQEGTLKASAPVPAAALKNAGPLPEATSLPKPCWIGLRGGAEQARARNQVTLALHVGANGAVLYETSRIVEDNGQLRKWCRLESRGQVTRRGNSVVVSFDKQAWTAGSDQVLSVSLSGLIFVGRQMQFDISGDDLIEHVFGTRLSPVP